MSPQWDDIREKFERDSNDARSAREAANNNQRTLHANAPHEWGVLRNEVNTAVNSINASQKILLFADAEAPGEAGFSVVYARAAERREARVTFDRQRYAVAVHITVPNRDGRSADFKMRINDQAQIVYDQNLGVQRDRTWLVRFILDGLL